VGPWMGKTFPELLAKKTRVPIGYVCYFATPVGDHRFTYPNLPSYNFPGVTGWPALPVDNRGFRVRGAERAPTPPGEVANANGPNNRATNGVAASGGNIPPVSAAGASTGGATPAGANGSGARGTGGTGGGRGGGGRGGGRGGGGAGGGGGGGGFQQQDVPPQQQDPDTSDRWADADRILGSRRFVSHRFPILKDAPIAQTHACHYESTSSGNFIVDVHPHMSNAWIVAGDNAEGCKFCPVIGEYAAQRVMGIEGDPAVAKSFRIPEKDYEPPLTAAQQDSIRKAQQADSAKRITPQPPF
jgi:hypothetical protein